MVEGDSIHLFRDAGSVYALAQSSMCAGISLSQSAAEDADDRRLGYDEIYAGRSPWRILPCIDHPLEPARCMVSGTGLSHMRSAGNRQAMHASGEQITPNFVVLYDENNLI